MVACLEPKQPPNQVAFGQGRRGARNTVASRFLLLALQELVNSLADQPRDCNIVSTGYLLQPLDLRWLQPHRSEFLPHVKQCITLIYPLSSQVVSVCEYFVRNDSFAATRFSFSWR